MAQYVGHIFFKDYPTPEEEEEASEEYKIPVGLAREYQDPALVEIRGFLSIFCDFSTESLVDCLKYVEENLHANLYDVLQTLRNPETSSGPGCFTSARELVYYSYRANKVFPRFRIPNAYEPCPLFRNTGRSSQHQSKKGKNRKSKRKGKARASNSPAEPEGTYPEMELEEMAASGEFFGNTSDGETAKDPGDSLLPQSDQPVPSGKNSHFARKRRGAISSTHPPEEMTAPSAGTETVATAA
jgi:hypothetical protein